MRHTIWLIICFMLLPLVSAQINVNIGSGGDGGDSDVDITITESGKIIDYFGQQYVVPVTGTLVVANPSLLRVFDVTIPMNIGQLTIIDVNDGGYFFPTKLQIPMINPEETLTIPYRIVGINPTNPVTTNASVLFNAVDFDNIAAKSVLEARLYKGAVENGSTRRLVSVHMNNPTSFNYKVNEIQVRKTIDNDPNSAGVFWNLLDLFPDKTQIDARERFTMDIYDQNSTDGDVYWLSTDVQLADFDIFDFGDTQSLIQVDEQGLFTDPEEVVDREIEEFIEQTDVDLIVRKVVSGKVIQVGDRLNVTLIIDNLAKQTKATDITDTIPVGFRLISQSDGPVVDGNTLFWDEILVNGQSSKYLKYVIEYFDEESIGIDYFSPVEVNYGNKTSFSPRVPFIRRFQPKQELYIQKRLKYIGKDVVEVTLTLQNLGETDLTNIVLQEFLDQLDDFRQITQIPEDKGQWLIAIIPAGQSWTVTYITNEHSRLNSLPEVYGIDRTAVQKSIILVHTIESTIQLTTVQWMEIIGLSSVILIAGAYGALWKFGDKLKRHALRKKKPSQGELRIIKEGEQKEAPLPTMSSSADFEKAAPMRESERLEKESQSPPPK